MNKSKIVAIVLALLILPFATQAFSWRNLAFWDKQKEVTQIKEPKIFDAVAQKESLKKSALWQEAFTQKKWDKLIKDQNNFQISDTELNFLIKEAIKKQTNSPVESVIVAFKDNKTNIEGQLNAMIKGKFEITAKINSNGKTLNPVIEKIRFKGFPVPKSYANSAIEKYFPDLSAFLYTYPKYSSIDVSINDGLLKLNYK
ncbi:MAG: hypothetical protein UT02_C0014G0004 [Parcubacteria group bacterium GW2011_GWC2_38_7]|nr:MAG: hypothetical protein UT02_C0014G0004 [Parcubacteria group bacterium GW2011_GWC2_38_7]